MVLVVVEVDEAFANIYSTAVSAQNVLPGGWTGGCWRCSSARVATVLAFAVDVTAYEPFLFLIGAVFVPLVGVFVVAYFLVPRGAWDTSETAPARPAAAAAVAGRVRRVPADRADRAVGLAGLGGVLAARPGPLHISPTNGFSASLVALAVAALLTPAGAARQPAPGAAAVRIRP